MASMRHSHIHSSDIKCENILLDSDRNVKLSDFGFSMTVEFAHQKLSTHCGSYSYAAPEILNGQTYDGTQVDAWSWLV